MPPESRTQTVKNLYLVSKRTNRRYVLNGDLEDYSKPEGEAFSLEFADHMVIEARKLPPKVDLRPWMTEVENQASLKSCTANAVAGAYEYLYNKATGDKIDVSRLFIYYNSRIKRLPRFGELKDAGSAISDAIASLSETGVCLEDMWKYDRWKVNDQPYSDCYEAAKEHMIVEALEVHLDLTELKTCLAQGFPIVISINVYKSFDEAEKKGIVPMPRSDDELRAMHGRHAVLLVGYSNSSQAFIVRNSWGTEWGDQGYCYIPYKYITNPNLTNYAWTVKKLNVQNFDHVGWCPADAINYREGEEEEEFDENEGAARSGGDDEDEADIEEVDEDIEYVEYNEDCNNNNNDDENN